MGVLLNENRENIKNVHSNDESSIYILLSLKVPRHRYGIIKYVEELTERRLVLGSGTIYGTLTKMQRDGIIAVYADEKRKKIYEVTNMGKTLMRREITRLNELHANAVKYGGEFQ